MFLCIRGDLPLIGDTERRVPSETDVKTGFKQCRVLCDRHTLNREGRAACEGKSGFRPDVAKGVPPAKTAASGSVDSSEGQFRRGAQAECGVSRVARLPPLDKAAAPPFSVKPSASKFT